MKKTFLANKDLCLMRGFAFFLLSFIACYWPYLFCDFRCSVSGLYFVVSQCSLFCLKRNIYFLAKIEN